MLFLTKASLAAAMVLSGSLANSPDAACTRGARPTRSPTTKTLISLRRIAHPPVVLGDERHRVQLPAPLTKTPSAQSDGNLAIRRLGTARPRIPAVLS